jgi:hypothetical protein
MSSPFEIASAVEPLEPGRFRVRIPEGWQQGRGAFGGLVLGALLRAMERMEPDRDRAVRTLTGDLAGPVLAGEAEIVAQVVRRGSNQTNVRAELHQAGGGGEAIAFATAVLSAARPCGLPAVRPRVAGLPPFDAAVVLPLGAPRAPVFTKHYEYRPTGPKPWSGGPEPVVAGWVREPTAPTAIDAPMLVALLDSFWPASFSAVNAPRPMATVSFTAEIVCDPRRLDPSAPFFYQARTLCEHQGFQVELRELYDARGEILALNQQTFAILK